MDEKIKIEKLSLDNLRQASVLADRIFADNVSGSDSLAPSRDFEASLDENGQGDYGRERYGKIVFTMYFVALNEDREVVGTCGLYELDKDKRDADWLGWFCVDEEYRNCGVGSLLLDHAICKVKERGKSFLRLYTPAVQGKSAAQDLYLKKGFQICDGELFGQNTDCKIFQKDIRT
jgi:GNAT superfamily N-acetyltransferase